MPDATANVSLQDIVGNPPPKKVQVVSQILGDKPMPCHKSRSNKQRKARKGMAKRMGQSEFVDVASRLMALPGPLGAKFRKASEAVGWRMSVDSAARRWQSLPHVQRLSVLVEAAQAMPIAAEKEHEFSCVMAELPREMQGVVRCLAAMVQDDDLAEDGRECNPHVTVKFGLHTDRVDDVQRAVLGESPIACQLGKCSTFTAPNHDVVKIEIESGGLHELHERLSAALANTETHPTYQPHVTIAYVKPGLGEHYAKTLNNMEGKVFAFDRIVFSDKRRKHTTIPLTGKAVRFSLPIRMAAANPWILYRGPRGGKGWKHSGTGDIRYGGDRPGAQETGGDDKAETPSKLHPAVERHVGSRPREEMTQGEFANGLTDLLRNPDKYGLDDDAADRLEQAVLAAEAFQKGKANKDKKAWWAGLKPHEKLDTIDEVWSQGHADPDGFKQALTRHYMESTGQVEEAAEPEAKPEEAAKGFSKGDAVQVALPHSPGTYRNGTVESVSGGVVNVRDEYGSLQSVPPSAVTKPAEQLKGGKADNRPDTDFDADALAKGTAVESEHSTDKAKAAEIAKDHLAEDPKYYDKLEKMEGEKPAASPERVEVRGDFYVKSPKGWTNETNPIYNASDEMMARWRERGIVKEAKGKSDGGKPDSGIVLETESGRSGSGRLPAGEQLGADAGAVSAGKPAESGQATGGEGGVSGVSDGARVGSNAVSGTTGGRGDATIDGARTSVSESLPGTELEQPDTADVQAAVSKPPTPKTPTDLSAGNWKYHSRDFASGGLKTKFRNNIAALKVMEAMKVEGRTHATPEEQAVLSKWVGWGQFPAVFNEQTYYKRPAYSGYNYKPEGFDAREELQKEIDPDYKPDDWESERIELKSLLSESEWQDAKRSTLNAHFTHPDIVDAHWAMAKRLGYTGGRFLETSAGIGYYLGQMPAEMAARTHTAAVELESRTGEMLKALYPKTHVAVEGFQDFKAPDNFYELVASNVPFAKEGPYDPRYAKYRASLHDYFFLKSADVCKPGGLIMHITSTGTMDKADPAIRQRLMEQCDLVAAYRMPGDTHKENAGTSVVTDMVILRKRLPGEKPVDETETPPEAEPKQPGFTGQTTDSLGRLYHWKDGVRVPGPRWDDVVQVDDPDGGDPIPVNRYFAEHPEAVLGRLDRSGTMYSGEEKGVSLNTPEDLSERLGRKVRVDVDPENKKRRFVFDDTGEPVPRKDLRQHGEAAFKERLQAAIESLPEGVFHHEQGSKAAFQPDVMPAPGDIVDGGFTIKDGKLYQRQGGGLVEQKATADNIARIGGMLGIRDAARAIINKERLDQDATEDRNVLNERYDAYVDKYGFLNDRKNSRPMVADPDSFLLRALEKWDAKEGKATKADMFSKRTVGGDISITKADNVADGLGACLHEFGRVNIEHIAELTGQPVDDVGFELVDKGLAFEDPQEGWKPADQYLSGNVRRKLIQAQAAAAVDPKYQPNVEALLKAQPEDVDYSELAPKMGAPWIPPQDIQAFGRDLLNANGNPIEVMYTPETGEWQVRWSKDGKKLYSNRPQAKEVWGTPRADIVECFKSALTGKSITIRGGMDRYTDEQGVEHEFFAENEDGEPVVNKSATADANAKVQEIRERMKEWLWEDEERTERLARYYNDNFNNIKDIHYNGQHLTFPGMNPTAAADTHPHIRDFVWQVVTTGKGLAAHQVGLGKTRAMIAAAMELRRLGLAKKPCIACLKSNIEQITKEVIDTYPGAKILSTSGLFTAKQRQEAISRMATGDYDIVLMTHDQLNRLKMSPEIEAKYIREELAELEAAKSAAEQEAESEASSGFGRRKAKDNRRVKALEKAKLKLEARLKEALSVEKKDRAMAFDDIGIDMLMVDECFPGDTVVETDQGPLTIGEIVDKRRAVQVLSCNRDTHELEYMPVVSWFKRPLRNHLVKVRHEHGEFVCTPNHNVWTEEEGYVQAGLLESRHTLRVVQKGICAKPPSESILLEEVLCAGPMESQGFSGEGGCGNAGNSERSQSEGIVGQNDKTQSDGRSSDSREGEAIAAWQAILVSGRERKADAGTTTEAGIRSGVDDGICDPNAGCQVAISETPELLQSGHCTSWTEGSDRSGRTIAQHDDRAATGCTQDGGAIVSRVVSVALHQRADYGHVGGRAVGSSDVYDIEVEGNHNYFADGVNVSNSHQYKSLPCYTKQDRIKGIPTNRSQRATTMLMRSRWLQEQNGGRGIVFATGTPISNTMAELYNIQRYLQYDELKERGIHHFDAWCNTFGEITTKPEFTVAGEYKPATRLSAFSNIPELMHLSRSFMDVVRADDVKRLNPKTGEMEPVIKRPNRKDESVVSRVDSMPALMSDLVRRAKAVSERRGPPEKGSDNMLVICTDGRKGAVDMRLLDDNAPDDPNSKTNLCVNQVLKLSKERPDQAQIIFCDLGVHAATKAKHTGVDFGERVGPDEADADEEQDDLQTVENGEDFTQANLGANGKFRLYDDIIDKLVKGGIPREQIADFSKLAGEDKIKAMAMMRNGEIKVAIGSTQKLGTGTNVQNRLMAMHHLDVPWVPASVEQRDGRGWRHGNTNKEVGIYRYVAEGSLDQKFWDIISTKAKFQDQVLHNRESNIRTVKDDDTEVLTPEQLMAIASGDTRQMDRVNLEEEVKTLSAAEKRHEREQKRIKGSIEKLESEVPEMEETSKAYEQDVEHLKSKADFEYVTPAIPEFEGEEKYYSGQGWRTEGATPEVPSVTHTKRKDGEEALTANIEAAVKKYQDMAKEQGTHYLYNFKPIPLGEYRGFKIAYDPRNTKAGLSIEGKSGKKYDAGTSVGSIDYVLRDIARRKTEHDKFLEAGQKQLETAKSAIGKKFGKAKELKEKTKQLEDLLGELGLKKKDKAKAGKSKGIQMSLLRVDPVAGYDDDLTSIFARLLHLPGEKGDRLRMAAEGIGWRLQAGGKRAERWQQMPAVKRLSLLVEAAQAMGPVIRMSGGTNPWVAYRGPRGGKGWKHSGTGDVRYGGDRPGADETGSGGKSEETPSPFHPSAARHLADQPRESMTQEQFGFVLNQLLEAPEDNGLSEEEADRLEEAVVAVQEHVDGNPAVKAWWHGLKPHQKLDTIGDLMAGGHKGGDAFKAAFAKEHGAATGEKPESKPSYEVSSVRKIKGSVHSASGPRKNSYRVTFADNKYAQEVDAADRTEAVSKAMQDREAMERAIKRQSTPAAKPAAEASKPVAAAAPKPAEQPAPAAPKPITANRVKVQGTAYVKTADGWQMEADAAYKASDEAMDRWNKKGIVEEVQAEKGAAEPKSGTILHRFPGEEGTETVVSKHDKGYAVALRDTDAGETAQGIRIFPTEEAAVKHAKTVNPPKQSPAAAAKPATDLFGAPVKPSAPKSEPIESLGGKQQGLFQKKGLPGQQNLFADRGVPEDMVQKPSKTQAPAEQPKGDTPWTGGDIAKGRVYNIPTKELHIDPERFQFKIKVDKSGVTDELKSVRKWNPDFAGVLAVWRDPADNKTYVVNGHHRAELANRLEVPDLPIRYIEAANAKEARSQGALINIAEGRGTAVDAAKYMRDSGDTIESMSEHGVSVKGRVAADAAVLSGLSDRAFTNVVREILPVEKALAVAKYLKPHELQDQLFRLLEKREDAGKDLSMRVIEEMAREMAATPTTKTTEKTLFGDIESEESLFVPRNELKSHVRADLSREVRDFLAVASKRRASAVAGSGNVLNVDENKRIADESSRVLGIYDTLVNRKGPIADAINQGAADYAQAKTKGNRDAVRKRTIESVRQAVFTESGLENDAGGTVAMSQRRGADATRRTSGGSRPPAGNTRRRNPKPSGLIRSLAAVDPEFVAGYD